MKTFSRRKMRRLYAAAILSLTLFLLRFVFKWLGPLELAVYLLFYMQVQQIRCPHCGKMLPFQFLARCKDPACYCPHCGQGIAFDDADPSGADRTPDMLPQTAHKKAWLSFFGGIAGLIAGMIIALRWRPYWMLGAVLAAVSLIILLLSLLHNSADYCLHCGAHLGDQVNWFGNKPHYCARCGKKPKKKSI